MARRYIVPPSQARATAPVLTNAVPGASFVTSVSANSRYMLDQNGDPILMVADAAWGMAANISLADMATYMADRQSLGFNTSLTELVADTYSGISPVNAQTFDGINAFTGTVTGPYPDLSTPNPVYWERMDSMVAMAQTYGLTMMLEPFDAVNEGGSPSYMLSAARANGHTACVNYGTFLGNRYKNSSNVIWLHGNDYYSGTDDTYVAGVMQGIQGVWPASLHTLEQGAGEGTYSLQAASVWTTAISFDLTYPGAAPVYPTTLAGYQASPTMPTFNGETLPYEGASSTRLQLRTQPYTTIGAGGIGGYMLGAFVGFGTGWQSSLSSPGAQDVSQWAKIMKGIQWWTLAPDSTHSLLTAGYGSGTTLATAAMSGDGKLAVVYNPDTTVNSITLSATPLAASPTITAVDPTNGATSSLGWTTAPTKGANALGDHDWLFIIRAG